MAQQDRRKHTERRVEQAPQKPGGLSIRLVNVLMVVLVAVVAIVFLQGVREIDATYTRLETASDTYMRCETAASKLREASRSLTYDARTYVVSQADSALESYFNEVLMVKEREKAIATIEENSTNSEVLRYLRRALERSRDLQHDELYAIMLVASAVGKDLSPYAEAFGDMQLTEEDAALSRPAKISLATTYLFGEGYTHDVKAIIDDIDICRERLMVELSEAQLISSEDMRSLLVRQQVITWVFLAVVIAMIVLFVVLVLWPLGHFVQRMRENSSLPVSGATEMRGLAQAYNIMYEENMKNHDALRRKAEHDHMTGLYNRSVFEKLLEVYSNEPFALLLIDADHFKEVNDTLGHDGGDAMLKKIASNLDKAFRSSDHPCRIGGDEFAVIMTGIDSTLKSVVEMKIKMVTDNLKDTSDGLPPMTLSVGVAFNDGTLSADRIFKNADQALYEVKENGRNGFAFFE